MLVRCALSIILVGSCLGQNLKRMDQIVASYVADQKFMGAVLVARGRDLVFSKGYGLANLEWDIPNSPETKFRIGSITKQFTAASILLLEERGKLKVSDPLRKYLPEAPAAWDKVTIFHLLTHTSGIPDDTESRDWDTFAPLLTTHAAFFERFRGRPLDFEPGNREYYDNSGYALLGCLIEKVSGVEYGTFIRENLFTPLGMKDSGLVSTTAVIPRLASGYARGKGNFEYAHPVYASVYEGAGALYSTTGDLLRWESGLFGGQVLSTASLEKMTTPFKNNYAFGLVIRTYRGQKVIGHSGSLEGVATQLDYYPADKLTVAVLGNMHRASSAEIARLLARLAHGEPVKLQTERREVPIDPKRLARYIGAYQLSSGGKLLITTEDNHLLNTPENQAPATFFPESERSFFRKGVDEQIEFAADTTSSHANQLVLHREEGDTTANRLDESEFRRLSDVAARAAVRYKEQRPFPGSETALQKIINDLRSGLPDYDMMRPGLAAAIRGQMIQLQTLISERGSIQSVSFREVGPAGPDVYVARGEKGSLECQIWLAPDGKVAGLNFRRLQ